MVNTNLVGIRSECMDAGNKKISFVIIIHLFLTACKNMLVATIPAIADNNSLLNSALLVVILFLYVYLIFSCRLLKRIPLQSWIILILLGVFVFITFLLDSKRFTSKVFPYTYVLSQGRTFLIYCLPLFIAFSSLSEYDDLLNGLKKYSWILFVFATIGFVFGLINQNHNNDYSMSYGNAVLLLSMILLEKYKENFTFLNFIELIFTVLYILICGSRGPLVSIFVAFIFAVYQKKVGIVRKTVGIILPLFILIFLLNYNIIINELSDFFSTNGINSRTIAMLETGSIFDDSGRSEYITGVIEKLNKYPIIGLGAFGGEATVGLTHNLYVDILANFGYLFGGIFLFIILLFCLYVLIKIPQNAYKSIFFIFALMVFPRGFFNDSFWASKELWIIIAMMIPMVRYKKEKYLD